MSEGLRLASGGRIDRSLRIDFKFDGRSLHGFDGDTVASALLAAGIPLVARSFRLHRPRGILSSGLEEPNALVHVRIGEYEEPNVRATLMPLRPGLEVFSQNSWPSLSWDVGALLDVMPKLWAAGFYQKTFMWPSWHFYEPLIRRAAGIGRIRTPTASAGTFSQHDVEADVAVVGGGIAGISAALAAARGGASVALIHGAADIGGRAGVRKDLTDALRREGRVRLLRNAVAAGVFGDTVLLASQECGWGAQGPHRRLLRIRASALVMATGMLEQPLTFENNDRPGVMLAGAVSRYLDHFGVIAGRRAVLVTNHDESYRALAHWQSSGIAVAAVIDSRERPGLAAQAAVAALGIAVFAAPRKLSVRGRAAVRGMRIRDRAGNTRTIACDLVAMSGGWVPNVNLYSQAQGALRYESGLHAYIPAAPRDRLYAVGGAAGLCDPSLAETQATAVGHTAALRNARAAGESLPAQRDLPPAQPDLSVGPTCFPGRPHRQWLDFQHDVTVSDVAAAVQQGYTQVEHFKRYTTTGMSIDQGKTSLRNSLDQLAKHSGQPLADIKPPTYRPPYAPLALACAAGPNVGRWYRPERRLPCHEDHVRMQAHFDEVGGWRRPLYYSRPGGAPECVIAEVNAVRTAAGIFDASPLGKFEITGPDAAEFLDRLCVNNLKSLKVGSIRYVLLLRDNGTVLDDGTVTRIATEEFVLTTTSGNAERAYLWMRQWAEREWPQLEVLITPRTTAWGTITLSGPNARAVLQRAGTDIDIGPQALAHMSYSAGRIAQIPARIHRVSFTGEASFEINVPVDATPALWQALQRAGAPGMRPYGIDALNILRTEKGYLHIGADTDATTTPLDLGWGKLIDNKPSDFIGRGALGIAEYGRAERLHLVGVIAAEPGSRLLAGSHLLQSADGRSEGYITSACFSPTLGYTVALARLERGRERLAAELMAYDQGATTPVRVVPTAFYDPKNERLHN
jgi:sarcosine oxidase subunit alpha